MTRPMTLFALCGALAACAAPPSDEPPPGAPGVCRLAPDAPLQGHHISSELEDRALKVSGATLVRVIRPGQVVTKEFNQDRVNLQLDSYDVVGRAYCG